MPKKLKVIDSDDGVDLDSDKKKKVKKKTKAKKKTTKKKDKGITINVNVGSSGGNNKKTGKGGKGGFGGGVKSNRGFFSYASKDKNANKYNTTEPANIKPLAYNQSMVSGHLDKNDAKDIEKIKDKLTKQDNNIIQGVESLKNLQNQLFQIENSPKKEIVYLQSPYNNDIPASAIKEVKKRGRPKNPYKVELPKETKGKGQVGRPKGSKNKPKNSTAAEPKQNLSVKFEEALVPGVKVYTNPQDEAIPQFSFSDLNTDDIKFNPSGGNLDLPPVPNYDNLLESVTDLQPITLKPVNKQTETSKSNKPVKSNKPLSFADELKAKVKTPNLRSTDKQTESNKATKSDKPLSFADELKLKVKTPNLRSTVFEDQNEETSLINVLEPNDIDQPRRRGRPPGSKNKPKEPITLMDQLKSAITGRRSHIKDDEGESETNNAEWV
jgi:hypothetical protein